MSRRIEALPAAVLDTIRKPDGGTAVIMEEPDLPKDDRKRVVCLQHLVDGAFSEVTGDFQMHGAKFPEDSDPDPVIRFQHVCNGRKLLGGCGLKIVQFDSQGAEVK